MNWIIMGILLVGTFPELVNRGHPISAWICAIFWLAMAYPSLKELSRQRDKELK
jgi:hypothetical protein